MWRHGPCSDEMTKRAGAQLRRARVKNWEVSAFRNMIPASSNIPAPAVVCLLDDPFCASARDP